MKLKIVGDSGSVHICGVEEKGKKVLYDLLQNSFKPPITKSVNREGISVIRKGQIDRWINILL